jgi:hypothetical protein
MESDKTEQKEGDEKRTEREEIEKENETSQENFERQQKESQGCG